MALAPFLADGGRGMARWSLGDLARAQARPPPTPAEKWEPGPFFRRASGRAVLGGIPLFGKGCPLRTALGPKPTAGRKEFLASLDLHPKHQKTCVFTLFSPFTLTVGADPLYMNILLKCGHFFSHFAVIVECA